MRLNAKKQPISAYQAGFEAGLQAAEPAKLALQRIAGRARRILQGEIETTAIGAADYDLQVANAVLGDES